jgi:hypothetical protein
MLYLLTPRDPSHPDWALSSYRAPVQVIAASESEARAIATLRFITFSEPHVSPDTSWGPWKNTELVTACEIARLDDNLLILSARG